jgi:hypothetical protein
MKSVIPPSEKSEYRPKTMRKKPNMRLKEEHFYLQDHERKI